eukprot:COSAG01_NODE_69_length_28801_cov_10.460038_3_plen_320_part_00
MQKHKMLEAKQINQDWFSFLSNSNTVNPTVLNQQLDSQGMLIPVYIINYQHTHYLIDGFKRVTWAAQTKQAIPAIINEIENPEHLGSHIFKRIQALKSEISQNPIIHAQLLKTLQAITKSKTLPQLANHHLESNSQDLNYAQHLKKLANFSPEILNFCLVKKLSFTHCKKLLNIATNKLENLMSLDKDLQWTAANFMQAASYYNEAKINQNSKNLQEQLIVTLKENPSLEKQSKHLQKAFLKTLKNNYRPQLKHYQDKIERHIKKLNLPKNITINWDKSLEKHELNLNIKIEKKGHLTQKIKALSNQQIQSIDQLLELL